MSYLLIALVIFVNKIKLLFVILLLGYNILVAMIFLRVKMKWQNHGSCC